MLPAKHRKNKSNEKRTPNKICGVDLFCGAGGLTRGLEAAGINVVMGVDIDPACEYPYTANNRATFLLKSVEDVSASDFTDTLDGAALTLLGGSAPCQPFSKYSQGESNPSDKRWNLLNHFTRLVKEMNPDLVTMENVPLLEKQAVFSEFVADLTGKGFHVTHQVVNCADYGVPQQRQRLVLLASKLGPIEMIGPTVAANRHRTVRDAIEGLSPLDAGEISPDDHLHIACELSPLNLKRIRASKAGGTWRDWDRRLVATCHKKTSGKSYPSVYGRMSWDEPSPTITTQFFGFGNGRFGHPDQDPTENVELGLSRIINVYL